MNEDLPNRLPLAYQRGTQDFYGRDFVVTPDVLIPRPETEMVIDIVLSLVGKPYLPGVKPREARLPRNITVVDVGTGSGCIAVTLKLEIPEAKIVATDISKRALKIARDNAKNYDTSVEFMKSDLLDDMEIIPDLIVANLPYVDKDWEWVDEKALSVEPQKALYADNHGLELILRLIDQVCAKKIQHLILEADPCQHEAIVKYANKKGLKLVETRGFAFYLASE